MAVVIALVTVGVAFARGEAGGTAEPPQPPPSPSPGVPTDPGPRCEDAATDVTDLGVERTLARCAEGSPAAVVTPAQTAVRVALTERVESAAPLLVADAEGEFVADGLTVEIVDLAVGDAYRALATGDVDVVVGGIDGPFFDAVHAGLEARLVLGGAVAREPSDLDEAQTGLWLRADLMGEDGTDWRHVRGTTVLLPGGLGDAAVYPIDTILSQHSLDVNQVDVRTAGGARAVAELRAGSVGGAWLDEPHASEAAEDGALDLVATVPGSEALDGTVFGPRLLGPDRDVGLAYVRAVIRTINTHLADGYDAEALRAVASALDVDEDAVAAGPQPLFDWEVRAGTSERIQAALVEVGGVGYERPIAEADLVDRSLVTTVLDAAA